MYIAALNTGGTDVRGHIVSAPHGTRPGALRTPAGYLPRTMGAPAYRTEPVRLPAGTLTGALHFTKIHQAPPGHRKICDHTCRRNEDQKVPVRSLNPRQAAG